MIQICEIIEFLKSQGIEFSFVGDMYKKVEGFSSLNNYRENTITWIKADNSISDEFNTHSIALAFVQEGVTVLISNQIISKASKLAFFNTIDHFFNNNDKRFAVGQGTYISPSVKMGQNIKIGYNCVLDGDITIGDNTQIWDNVTIINKVTIGCNCDIHSGVRIGHDGFSYNEDCNHIKKMVKHYGGVVLGYNVLIGPNSVIDQETI